MSDAGPVIPAVRHGRIYNAPPAVEPVLATRGRSVHSDKAETYGLMPAHGVVTPCTHSPRRTAAASEACDSLMGAVTRPYGVEPRPAGSDPGPAAVQAAPTRENRKTGPYK